MNTIQENIFMRIVWAFGPVLFLCLLPLLIFVALISAGIYQVLTGDLEGVFVGVILLFIVGLLCVLFVLLGKPVWYRSFFDPLFIGLDRVTRIEWDEKVTHFSGAFFDFKVFPDDVLSYKIYGFPNENQMFVLNVKVKVKDKIQTVSISTTMPDKMRFFSFLESIKVK